MAVRLFGILAAVAAAAVFASTASADPSHNVQPPQPLTCDNGMQIVINPGTLTNRSHQAFVVGSTSIFVAKYVAFSDATGTFVLFETAPGQSGLITCTGDAGGGFTITLRGFFTPRT
jgi:hypothetical protein